MARTWLLEKKSVAETLAKAVLGGIASQRPAVIKTKNGDTIVYTTGHLITQAEPKAYDPAYASFSNCDVASLVASGFKMQPTVDRKTNKPRTDELREVSALLAGSREVVIATDPGREGELIAWNMIIHSGYTGPVLRMWTASMSPAGLAAASTSLAPGNVRKPLYLAGQARARADWIEGLSFSRSITKRHGHYDGGVLSIGRVQTPLVALVDDRCREIETFVPRDFWVLVAQAQVGTATFQMTHRRPAQTPFANAAEAQKAAKAATGATIVLGSTTTARSKAPPGFMTTPEMLQIGFRRFGLDPEVTLARLQILYETGKISYPRTGCALLETAHQALMPALMTQAKTVPAVAALALTHPAWFLSPVIRSDQYDDTILNDHHAILPTGTVVTPASLGAVDGGLYEAIVRRMVACLCPDHRWNAARLSTTVLGDEYVATGRTVTDEGWKAIDVPEDTSVRTTRRRAAAATLQPLDDQTLPLVANGTPGSFGDVKADGRSTKPPPYYDKATIIDAMTNLDLHLANPGAKAVMTGPDGKRKGLGTPATQSTAIAKILSAGYVHQVSGVLRTTDRGRQMLEAVRSSLPWMADPLHTVQQETTLQEIEAGRQDDAIYVESVRQQASHAVAKLAAAGVGQRVADREASAGFGSSKARPSTRPRAASGKSTRPQVKGVAMSRPKPRATSAASTPARARPTAPSELKTAPTGRIVTVTQPRAPTAQTTVCGIRRYFSVPGNAVMKARIMGLLPDMGAGRFFAPSEAIAIAACAKFTEVEK